MESDKELAGVEAEKSLSVCIEQKLNLDTHITSQVNKARSILAVNKKTIQIRTFIPPFCYNKHSFDRTLPEHANEV